jgi:tetratricopeptide (TPR) repeat protein
MMLALAGEGAAGATPTFGADFSRDTAPGKWIAPLVPEQIPPPKYSAYFNTFDKAREQIWTGRYKLGLQTLVLVKPTDQGADPVSVARLKGDALCALGRYDEAIVALSAADVINDAEASVDRAVILNDQGKPADAIALLKSVIAAHPNTLNGHYQLGRIAETIDDLNTAKPAYEWFVQPGQDYLKKWRDNPDGLFKSAADATTVGLALDRWAVLFGQYQTDSDLNQSVLDFFVKAYDSIDRRYWPAHVAAARFYVDHDDENNALQELKQAMGVNPNAPEAIELYGSIIGDFDAVDSAVAAIRAENPESVDADLMEAHNLLQQRQPMQAAVLVRQVLARRPDLLEARGMLAATEALQLHDDETKKLLADVDKISPTDAQAYLEVAEQLAAMRQYPRAEAMYKIAIERAPWWNAPRNGLGLLYTQSGDEVAALNTLNIAHNVDPFNVSTTNYLRLLDQMQSYARKESAHFIVVYDPKLDPMIPEYFNDYMESIYPVITSEYETEPKQKTIIEVFPTHDAFSVRTTGAPWIGTVGASTGRIIALVTPRSGPNTWKTYNWAQTLRHEFTHTVTLAATDNRISHWFTEGLAVYNERSPLYWSWVAPMYQAVTKDQLFNMDEVTFMFWRPKKPSDRQMAYAESFWICTYIEKTYGHEAILNMLREFKKGGLQDEVFPKVLGRSTKQFFTEFSAWAKVQVSTWGYDPASSAKYELLSEKGQELIDSAQDANIKASQLTADANKLDGADAEAKKSEAAEQKAIATKDYAGAVDVWEKIQVLRPMDQLPHQRLAGLYLRPEINQPLKAIIHLKMLHLLDQRDDRYAKRVARLYRDLGDGANAEAWGLQSVYMDPYDMDAHEILRDACEQAGDQKGLERETRVIPILKQWIEDQKKPKGAQ